MRALPVQIHVNAVPEPDRPPRSSSGVTNALTETHRCVLKI